MFPEIAVFEDLLVSKKTALNCITLDPINAYFTERDAEASRSKRRIFGMNMMAEKIGIYNYCANVDIVHLSIPNFLPIFVCGNLKNFTPQPFFNFFLQNGSAHTVILIVQT